MTAGRDCDGGAESLESARPSARRAIGATASSTPGAQRARSDRRVTEWQVTPDGRYVPIRHADEPRLLAASRALLAASRVYIAATRKVVQKTKGLLERRRQR